MNSATLKQFSKYSVLAILFLFSINATIGQMRIKGEVFYDAIGGPNAKVKLFKNNKLDQEFETSKKGKFNVMLDLDHEYLFEVSKGYHYTTRFIISTKIPAEKNNGDYYASFDVVTDLIRIFDGLDGSIMDNPIMILRYMPDLGGHDFDKDHLDAVRAKVEALMRESEKLESKGSKALVKPAPLVPKKAVVEKKEEVKKEEEVVEEVMEVSPTHSKKPIEKKIEEKPIARVEKKEEPKEKVKEKEPENESYEMKLRRERIEKERQRKENLALKRGFENSLIRQVAEESKRMSKSEYEQKKTAKVDSSLYEREKKEQEVRAYRSQQVKKEQENQIAKSENHAEKQQFEKGLIREVAASKRGVVAIKEGSKAEGEETEDGKKFYLEPKIYKTEKADQFKTLETIHIDYPSNSKLISVETYQFGMVNYYIDKNVVEKEKFCETIKDLELTKYNLPCD